MLKNDDVSEALMLQRAYVPSVYILPCILLMDYSNVCSNLQLHNKI